MKKFFEKISLPAAIIFAIFSIYAYSKSDFQNRAFKNKMLIFRNGYLRGELNKMNSSTFKESELQWKVDSTEMAKIITH